VEVSSCRLRTTDCPTEDWEIAFKFAASPNATDLTVGDITGIEKKGWEYLWVRYADAEDEETLIQQPVAAPISSWRAGQRIRQLLPIGHRGVTSKAAGRGWRPEPRP
jgi:hypothetical protein